MSKLTAKLLETRTLVDDKLEELLASVSGLHQRVVDAMRYSIIGGGKALRPLLILTVGDMLGLNKDQALRIACALEMVHTYSLIHDDLPAMDNDTLRRGKPSNHIQFDEATAILAGDALLTYAFEILADEKTQPDAIRRCLLISNLAKSAGFQGMIGGQAIDLAGEKQALNFEELYQMQSLKTGALLSYACIAPAISANASQQTIKALTSYAQNIGILFQITDDLLDITGNQAEVGKTLHKDTQAGKSTFISLLGIEKTKQLAYELNQKAKLALKELEEDTSVLEELADFILTRRH